MKSSQKQTLIKYDDTFLVETTATARVYNAQKPRDWGQFHLRVIADMTHNTLIPSISRQNVAH